MSGEHQGVTGYKQLSQHRQQGSASPGEDTFRETFIDMTVLEKHRKT